MSLNDLVKQGEPKRGTKVITDLVYVRTSRVKQSHPSIFYVPESVERPS